MNEQRCLLFDEDNNLIGLYPNFKAAHDAWRPLYDRCAGMTRYYIATIARVAEPAAQIVDVNE